MVERDEHVCSLPWKLHLRVGGGEDAEVCVMKELAFALETLGRQDFKQESNIELSRRDQLGQRIGGGLVWREDWGWGLQYSRCEVLEPQLRKQKWEGGQFYSLNLFLEFRRARNDEQ